MKYRPGKGEQMSFGGILPARGSDPFTSHDAAHFMEDTGKITELENKVLRALRDALPGGLTITETVAVLGLHPWSVSPRFRKLARKGLIIESGIKPSPRTGRKQIVWRALARSD